MGLFDKIKKLNIFSGLFSIDEDFFEELEEGPHPLRHGGWTPPPRRWTPSGSG